MCFPVTIGSGKRVKVEGVLALPGVVSANGNCYSKEAIESMVNTWKAGGRHTFSYSEYYTEDMAALQGPVEDIRLREDGAPVATVGLLAGTPEGDAALALIDQGLGKMGWSVSVAPSDTAESYEVREISEMELQSVYIKADNGYAVDPVRVVETDDE